ncbi:holin [Alkalicoccobacillus porphyridii]|uniref:Holin n=1 Tax=Alkalicoccobacillus porphyridii TaxID=2597270 RepID=A0A554A0A6_9BACI|nr:holin [Alkalicoccobacillus porphyridii]TSB47115.1 holin [Alkalicoccobacillus porphyridii]
MNEILLLSTLIAPMVTGVVQAVKVGFTLSKNFLPLIAMVLGIALGFLSYPFSDIDAASRLWAGGIAGLASVGLFELGNSRKGETKEDV